MKKLIITEEEKNRILGMHKRHLNEDETDSESVGYIGPDKGKNKPKEVDNKDILGDVINLYFNSNESKIDKQYKIISIEKIGPTVDVYLSDVAYEPYQSGLQRYKYTFYCDNGRLENHKKESIKQQFPGKTEAYTRYNNTLRDNLRKKYCSKNSSGNWAPNADIVSTGVSDSDIV